MQRQARLVLLIARGRTGRSPRLGSARLPPMRPRRIRHPMSRWAWRSARAPGAATPGSHFSTESEGGCGLRPRVAGCTCPRLEPGRREPSSLAATVSPLRWRRGRRRAWFRPPVCPVAGQRCTGSPNGCRSCAHLVPFGGRTLSIRQRSTWLVAQALGFDISVCPPSPWPRTPRASVSVDLATGTPCGGRTGEHRPLLPGRRRVDRICFPD
ncbi:MAG: hypothetical protein K0R41_306 [Geminicoccaceae bacterium]|jgi:hypothetical protein|nr:hypothetical protein [Geminicoccaceae bacterium]